MLTIILLLLVVAVVVVAFLMMKAMNREMMRYTTSIEEHLERASQWHIERHEADQAEIAELKSSLHNAHVCLELALDQNPIQQKAGTKS